MLLLVGFTASFTWKLAIPESGAIPLSSYGDASDSEVLAVLNCCSSERDLYLFGL